MILPTHAKQDPDLKTAELVIIQDIKGFDPILVEKYWEKTNLPSWFKDDRKSHERKSFIQQAREDIKVLELRMLDDLENEGKSKDLGWDIESLKQEVNAMAAKASKKD